MAIGNVELIQECLPRPGGIHHARKGERGGGRLEEEGRGEERGERGRGRGGKEEGKERGTELGSAPSVDAAAGEGTTSGARGLLRAPPLPAGPHDPLQFPPDAPAASRPTASAPAGGDSEY